MKAIICTKYGAPEVLQIRQVEKPTPKDDEVLIKIYATAVTASDIFIRSSNVPIQVLIPMRIMLGLWKPRKSIIGLVLAGEIESIGKDIKKFKIGDQVYGLTGFGLGAYAEYKCMKENDSTYGCLTIKPTNISYEEATVAAYGGLLAFQSLEKGNIQPGQNVLIYGASGTSGTIAIQLAKYLGAKVTGVCSTTNLALVKSLGADDVIDYTKVDTLDPNVQYDFILDAVGKMKTSKLKKACKKALAPKGKYVSIDDEKLMLDSKRLDSIKEVIEAGHIKPIIDKCYSFEDIVEAHRYVEKGHKKGGVAILINKKE
ncbi:NAD(P)-dependent alcohol dehydrogenase [Haliscomenobacter sp.]|uniref:NAD(P)-dependent alcohol dehydrogenase n=1 Tax=Haliscomenobacter sp. TaxID=2717303 RepID=UPI003593CFE3